MTTPAPAPPTLVVGGAPTSPGAASEDGPAVAVAARVLTLLSLLLVGVCLHLAVVSQVVHGRAQQVAHDDLRLQLARGTAPVGPTAIPEVEDAAPTSGGAAAPAEEVEPEPRLLASGTPVAVMSVPRLRLREEVVLEDTTSGVLQQGPGHDRLTAMPGQPGWVQVLGRRWTYGGPFRDLGELRVGDVVTFVTGQGRHEYEVTGLRQGDDPVPVLPPGQGRLVLVTASGPPFVTRGALYVDALLRTPPVAGNAARVLPDEPAALPLASDPGGWLSVLLWSQALLAAAVTLSWTWSRWGRAQTLFVAVPVLFLAVAGLGGAVSLVLPNLL